MKNQETILREGLEKRSMKQLVDMYNTGTTGKKIKKFSKKQVGIDKIVGLLLKHTVAKKYAFDIINNNIKLSNLDFSKVKEFKGLCGKAGIEPTKRQASKFRMERGLAYAVA